MLNRRFIYACLLTGTASAVAIPTALSGLVLAQVTTHRFPKFTSEGSRRARRCTRGRRATSRPDRRRAAFFALGKEDFEEAEGVGDGLGPRFNADGCGTCHSQPAIGGTAPAVNPLVALATAFGAKNVVPSFITVNGPIREARLKKNPDGTPDGGVHDLFVISGRVDDTGNASACKIKQEDFEKQITNRNIIFRIPTPVFGSGLIEMIKDNTLVANFAANGSQKAQLGISGRLNRNGNDGTVSRFGWKAQNQSLLLFSAEAYNVEMGITNEMFQSERDETANCQFATVPNDTQLFDTTAGFPALITAIENFANFQRFLDQPTPVTSFPGASSASINRGKQKFTEIGCAFCHTPSLTTSDVATVDGAPQQGREPVLRRGAAQHGAGFGG